MVMIGSANTDEAEFPDADEVRFDREVNRHIAFGGGVHRCLGSHLARLELRVALREWHKRIPEYEVEPDHDARLHDGHPLHRPLPDALHGDGRRRGSDARVAARRRPRARSSGPRASSAARGGPPGPGTSLRERRRPPAAGGRRACRAAGPTGSARSARRPARSASSTSRSRNSARARFPATSTWTVASPSGRCSGPWTRRMLWDFSSGTQVVARLMRPVTQTACAASWPAERKWKLSGALKRARPRRRRARRIGCAEQAGQQVPGVLLRSHRQKRLADDARALAALVARRRPGDVDLQAAPAERPPQQRLHLADGLDPAVGDGLGDGLQEAAPDAHPFGRLDRDEGVLARQPAPDHAGGAEQVHGEDTRHGRRRLRLELVEDRQRGHRADQRRW